MPNQFIIVLYSHLTSDHTNSLLKIMFLVTYFLFLASLFKTRTNQEFRF